MAKKYYAVRRGRKIGIFESWDECKKTIEGYSNAEYKGFDKREQAEAYLNGNLEREINKVQSINQVIAYVDGSYSNELKRYSYGLLMILPSGEKLEYNGYQDDEHALSAHNVAGELLGTMEAVKKAVDHGYNEIVIYHDYEGIAKWYTGEWKAESFVARRYLDFMREYRDKIKISFLKVKGHSGDPNNEIVDRLAKEALMSGQKPRTGENWIVAEPVRIKDIEAIIELLKEDFRNLYVEKSDEQHKLSWVIKNKKEKIVANYYKSTHKLLIQGRQENLFTVFSTYVVELLESDKICEVLNPYYQININKEIVEDEFFEYLPHKNIKFSDKLNNSIKQSIYNLHIDGDMYDYTFLSFPALRALEGFLKLILNIHNIECNRIYILFKKDTQELKEKFHEKIGSKSKIDYLNRAYKFYYNHRNTLFHWDYYEHDGIDTTRILDKSNWRDMIKDTLKLIDDYFVL